MKKTMQEDDLVSMESTIKSEEIEIAVLEIDPPGAAYFWPYHWILKFISNDVNEPQTK